MLDESLVEAKMMKKKKKRKKKKVGECKEYKPTYCAETAALQNHHVLYRMPGHAIDR